MTPKKTVFAGNANSMYDPGLIAKEVHDYFGQSIRTTDVRSIVTQHFSHFRVSYNSDNKPTKVRYYRGTKPYSTRVIFSDASGLNSKCFVLHSAPDNQVWIVWFNVDNQGIVPVVANAKFIEVPLNSSDPAEVVAAITKLTIDNGYSQYFLPGSRFAASLDILTAGLGKVDLSFDINSGLQITGTSGDQDLVQEVNIEYLGLDPYYEGQLLKNYDFDIYSGKFVKKPEVSVELGSLIVGDRDGNELDINADGSLNVNVVSTGHVLKSYFAEVDNVPAGITTKIQTYTATRNVYLQKIEVSGTNIAEFELLINGVIQDRKRTFLNGNLENVFNFNNGLNIFSGQTIEVFVVHTRPDLGQFSTRMQILE